MQNSYSFDSFDEIAEYARGASTKERENVKQYIIAIHEEALQDAKAAATIRYKKYGDHDLCGFAWVTAYVNGNSFVGRTLRSVFFKKAYGGGYELWNPSKLPYQSIGILEAGAMAYSNAFRKYIPKCKIYAGSRLD